MKKTLSAGGVVLNLKGEVLVVSQHGTSWSLPKGHLDEGESELEAAQREIREESGVTKLKLIKKLQTYERYKIGRDGGEDPSELKSIAMFLFSTDESELRPTDPTNPEAIWVKPSQVASILTHPKDKEFFLGILNQL